MSTAVERTARADASMRRMARWLHRASWAAIPGIVALVCLELYPLRWVVEWAEHGTTSRGLTIAVRSVLALGGILLGGLGVMGLSMVVMVARSGRAPPDSEERGGARPHEAFLAAAAVTAALVGQPWVAAAAAIALLTTAALASPVLPKRHADAPIPLSSRLMPLALLLPGVAVATTLLLQPLPPAVVPQAVPQTLPAGITEVPELGLRSAPRIVAVLGFYVAAGMALVRMFRALQVGRLVGLRYDALPRTVLLPVGLAAVCAAVFLDRGLALGAALGAALIVGGLLVGTLPVTRYTHRLAGALRVIPVLIFGGSALVGVALCNFAALRVEPGRGQLIVCALGGAIVGVLLAAASYFVGGHAPTATADATKAVFVWKLPRRPLEELAAEVRRSMPAPLPRAWWTAERLVALALRHRLERPFNRVIGVVPVPPEQLRELEDHPLVAVTYAWVGLVGDDRDLTHRAAALARGLPKLRQILWLLDDRVLLFHLDEAPVATLSDLDAMIEEERTGPYLLRWHWLRLRALGRLGRVGLFLRAAERLVDLVCGPRFEELLAVGTFTDVMRGGTRADGLRRQGEGQPLASSRLRGELLLRIDEELAVVERLAREGGDPDVDAWLHRGRRRLERRQQDFGVDADAAFADLVRVRRAYRELREEAQRARRSRDAAASALAGALTALSVRNLAPILAGMPGDVSRMTGALAGAWSPDKGGAADGAAIDAWFAALRAPDVDALDTARRRAAAMVDADLRPTQAFLDLRTALWMPEVRGPARALILRATRNQSPLSAFRLSTINTRWRSDPSEVLIPLDAAARGARFIGAPREGLRIAQEASRFARRFGDADEIAQVELLLAEIEDRAPTPLEGDGLWTRLVRSRACERALRECTTAEAFLDRVGIRDLPRYEGALIVQALVDNELLAAVAVGGALSLHRVPVQRELLLADLSELRTNLEGGQPASAWAPLAAHLAALLFAHLPTGRGPIAYSGIGALARVPIPVLPTAGGRLGLMRPWMRRSLGHTAPGLPEGPAVALWAEGVEVKLPTARPECEALRGFEAAPATRASVVEAASRASVLHVAAHGRADRIDPDQCALELVDGELTAAEIRALPIRPGALVYLSACESAVGSLMPEERTGGLAGAFLDAGAGAVVATQWMIPDAAAARMAVTFHGARATGAAPEQALFAARRECGGEPWEWGSVELWTATESAP